nr:unnamed protein product [Callosobruchus chinensis]
MVSRSSSICRTRLFIYRTESLKYIRKTWTILLHKNTALSIEEK